LQMAVCIVSFTYESAEPGHRKRPPNPRDTSIHIPNARLILGAEESWLALLDDRYGVESSILKATLIYVPQRRSMRRAIGDYARDANQNRGGIHRQSADWVV
jgi:hypothetical protein